jgi:uncharacterized LabA/DUF88 family protein
MRAFVYVDGFNLYYRALKSTAHKWLDLSSAAARLLSKGEQVEKVRYFTARVSPRAGDTDAPRRQQLYLSALATDPKVHVHYGTFLSKTKMRPLVAGGRFVEIHDTEEKGSDVNIAAHLFNDAWAGSFDLALVMSQDTDLVEPIRILVHERKITVGLIWLDNRKPNGKLAAAASFVRHLKTADLAAAQFADPIIRADGHRISKPQAW